MFTPRPSLPNPTGHDNDVAAQVMGLLSFFDGWLLARHQWIVQSMRSLVTGESRPALESLPGFAALPRIDLSATLRHEFTRQSRQLETLWQAVVSATQIRDDQSLTQSLDHFQQHVERFMREAQHASQTLWQDFALRDPLTGARTRLTLNSLLLDSQRACERGTPSAIVLFDQDDFKAVNDRWGQATGDTVLAATADLMRQHMRAEDSLFRYGGDEWLILLPGARLNEATAIAERIRDSVRRHPFAAPDRHLFYSDVSYGFAVAQPFDTPDTWIARADLTLYAMKQQRRTRAVSAAAAAG